MCAIEPARLPPGRMLLHCAMHVLRACQQAIGSLAKNSRLLRLHGAKLDVQCAEAREHRLHMGAYGHRLRDVGRSWHWAHEVVAGLHGHTRTLPVRRSADARRGGRTRVAGQLEDGAAM
jgi:hypothetical protein